MANHVNTLTPKGADAMSYTPDPKPLPDDDTSEEWDEEVLTDPDIELPDADETEPIPPT